MSILRRVAIAALTMAVLTGTALAAAAPKVELHLQGLVLTKHNGKTVANAIDHPLKAGETIEYRIEARNTGNAAAIGLAPVGKIPARTIFVRTLVAPRGAHVEYTLDGRRWAAHPTIRVVGPDGKPHLQPAPLAMYEAVRWTLTTPLPAHAAAVFAYEVRVK